MDEALWLPTESAVRLALRTQQIIAHESGVADSVDPLGGSYLIEYLTDEVERQARAYLGQIDEMGGALAAIERGFIQLEIQKAAYEYQRAVEEKREIVVGVNAFPVDEQPDLEQLKVDPAVEAGQRQRLQALRERRDSSRVAELLGLVDAAARGDQNLMPVLINCVEGDVTLGEICGALREVWGEYRPQGVLA
jgi:methylmalonyl-CoA mutase N-terminal domain/subunit